MHRTPIVLAGGQRRGIRSLRYTDLTRESTGILCQDGDVRKRFHEVRDVLTQTLCRDRYRLPGGIRSQYPT
jgi:hypothetical protein